MTSITSEMMKRAESRGRIETSPDLRRLNVVVDFQVWKKTWNSIAEADNSCETGLLLEESVSNSTNSPDD